MAQKQKEQAKLSKKIANGNLNLPCSSSKIDIYLRRRKQKFLRLEVKRGIYMKRRLHSGAISERPDTKDSFSKLALVHSESVFELPYNWLFDALSFVGVDYFVGRDDTLNTKKQCETYFVFVLFYILSLNGMSHHKCYNRWAKRFDINITRKGILCSK